MRRIIAAGGGEKKVQEVLLIRGVKAEDGVRIEYRVE